MCLLYQFYFSKELEYGIVKEATVEELKSIDGIGEVRASKIIEYREENGPYKNIDELKTIGARIGEKTFETIKDKVYVP